MQRLEVSGAVRPIYESLGVKRLTGDEQHGSLLCPTFSSKTYLLQHVRNRTVPIMFIFH